MALVHFGIEDMVDVDFLCEKSLNRNKKVRLIGVIVCGDAFVVGEDDGLHCIYLFRYRTEFFPILLKKLANDILNQSINLINDFSF